MGLSHHALHRSRHLTNGGLKTRNFDEILSELDQAFDIHRAEDSRLGGAHLEVTGEAVTECLGGARGLNETDLTRACRSYLDPRSNYEHALELAFFTARKTRSLNGGSHH